ncbi:NAD dependent epimerase dehydratase [Seminavis robusta]|uniref:NAD dependent epimerase dehydratase n=1 Tax=Seminavis robusta TaxID=568900 RepID=A0A9N8H8S8_9STRA|nr:NAD dependent epimerase dehydratase [Seminavis robusta]|eukprot:Sro229_g093070.1 NAD dependent epimerase dehydratase (339) ;mRNA; f:54117-55133
MVVAPLIIALSWWQLLVVASVATVAAPADNGALNELVDGGEEFRMNTWNFLYNWLLGGTMEAEKQPLPQPIFVIGAGLPRTGTASFRTAMGLLNMKSYHMIDGCMETPGHQDMWYKFLIEQSISIDDVLGGIAADGFNATIDTPTVFHYKAQMQRYPNAKVVLTVRDSPEQWANSFAKTIRRIVLASEHVPFTLIGPMARSSQFVGRMFENANLHMEDPSLLPQFYKDFVAEVKATVPADKLLVFNAKDGWDPLCKFVSPLAESIQEQCQKLLATGTPYPHVNDEAQILAVAIGLETITMIFKVMPFLLVVAICFLHVSRTAQTRPESSNNPGKTKTE